LDYLSRQDFILLHSRCNTCPLSERVQLARWKLLGHILRSPENSPAQSALCFVVGHVKTLPGRRGKHRINLFDVLKSDMKNRDILLNDYHDLLSLRILASDKKNWQGMFYLVDPG
jgi:hypothetical protein